MILVSILFILLKIELFMYQNNNHNFDRTQNNYYTIFSINFEGDKENKINLTFWVVEKLQQR